MTGIASREVSPVILDVISTDGTIVSIITFEVAERELAAPGFGKVRFAEFPARSRIVEPLATSAEEDE